MYARVQLCRGGMSPRHLFVRTTAFASRRGRRHGARSRALPRSNNGGRLRLPRGLSHRPTHREDAAQGGGGLAFGPVSLIVTWVASEAPPQGASLVRFGPVASRCTSSH